MKNPEINQFTLNSGILSKHKSTIYSNATWHKVEVENAVKLDRDMVLRILMNFVHPLDFIPVCYEIKGPLVSFLIKNCGAAIERLCRHNLIVPNPQDSTMPFKIKILLNFAYATDLKINIQNNITSILAKRFNSDTGVLNLETFYKDPDLIEFCTLSQPKLMFYILHLSRSENRTNQPRLIKLSNNEIEVLKPLEALFGLKSVTALDLRNNNIKEIDASYFKDLPITELWLDGNPICDEYDEFTYPKAMKDLIPSLEKLDGVYIQSKGMLPFRRNFLCTAAGHDVVDQFLEHYFNLYDARSRAMLEGMYHKDAMFSVTANYLALQTTSLNAKLTPYKKIARNLKMMSDFSKNDECLFRGHHAIMQILTSLPATEHDPYTFTVDLMSYTEMTAVLVVTGVFREAPENLLDPDRLLGFSRIFVLLAGQNNEYTIVNEQMHVSNATTTQAIRSFKQSRITRPTHIQIPLPQSVKEQAMLAEALVKLTGLNVEWATKCLEECHYDLKRSLELFVDLFKLDKIPFAAFRSTPSGEKTPSVIATALLERPGSKPSSVVPTPVASNVVVQEFVQPVQQSFVPPFEGEQKSKVHQFASNRAKKEQNRKRADHQNVCSNNSSVVKTGETIDLVDDDCMVIDNQSNPDEIYMILPPDSVESPYGIFDTYEPFLHPTVVDGVAQAKHVTKPQLTDLWPTACKLKGFRGKLKTLRHKCLSGPSGYTQSMGMALDIVKCYSYHIVTYQVLLMWYYPRHKPAAHEFCKVVYNYINANKRRCIHPLVFDILISECECLLGNANLGIKRFKALLREFPKQLNILKAYLRILCGKEEFLSDARQVVEWAMNVRNIDKAGVIKLVQEYETMFKIELLALF